MKVALFHGNPRKGNTFFATSIFMDELHKCGGVDCIEFFMPTDLPAFCVGCQQCLNGLREKCPNAKYVTPILDEIINADALVFATAHCGGSCMPGSMKNLLDHLDFLALLVSPRIAICLLLGTTIFQLLSSCPAYHCISLLSCGFSPCQTKNINAITLNFQALQSTSSAIPK